MRRVALALFLPVLISACATAPKYETPPTPQAAAGPFVTRPAGVDAAQAPQDDWWRLYDDPVLDRLVAQAFTANTDLRIAEANLRRSRAVLSESRTAQLPSTDVTGGGTYGDAPTSSGPTNGRDWSHDASLGVAWEVDLFGRIGSAIGAAKADAQVAEAARDLVRVAVAADTARAYSDACAYGDALAVARASVKMTRESLSLVSSQEQAGSASRLDVHRAASAVARTEAAVPPIEDLRRASLFELAALLGLPPSQVPAEATACVRPPVPRGDLPVGDGAALLRRRPDVRAAERRLAADTARIGVAVADLYPRVTLGGSVGYLDSDTTTSADKFSFSVGPMISWSFPNVTAARARVRQARAGSDATLAAFDGVVLTALKETEQALSTFGAAVERQRSLTAALARANDAFRLAGERYRAGTLSYLDVLVAQRELLEVSADYASTNQGLGAARVRLFKALGGGWNRSPASETAPL